MTEFHETLRSWQNFYFMIGGASATMVGLMFVALSLGINFVNDENRESIHSFATPSIFYFVSILLICCAMLVPNMDNRILALLLFLGSLEGGRRLSGYGPRIVKAAREYQDFDLAEWLAQLILPLVSYDVLMLGAAAAFAFKEWTIAFDLMAISVVLLLIAAIANTWSLVLSIVAGSGQALDSE
jgi:hypothetical protein